MKLSTEVWTTFFDDIVLHDYGIITFFHAITAFKPNLKQIWLFKIKSYILLLQKSLSFVICSLQVICCYTHQLTIYILATVWDISTSISNSTVFYILFSTPFKKADLILVTQSKLLFESNYLKSTAEGLSFKILIVTNASKTFGTLFPYYRWFKASELSMYHDLFKGFFHCKLVCFPVYSWQNTAAGTFCDSGKLWWYICWYFEINCRYSPSIHNKQDKFINRKKLSSWRT